jgi:hypothetical protein
LEGLYRCIKAKKGNADRTNNPTKETCTKIEAGQGDLSDKGN